MSVDPVFFVTAVVVVVFSLFQGVFSVAIIL